MTSSERALAALGMAALLASCGAAPPTPEQARASRARSRTVQEDPEAPPLPWDLGEGAPADPSTPAVALVGGTVMTGEGEILEDAVVLMRDGRIRAVARRDELSLPAGVQQIDVSGRFVTPGLIDVHSHMGVHPVPDLQGNHDTNEMTAPTTPQVRAADSFWPQDPALLRALAGGVTTIQVLPGSGNLIGGAGVILKLHLGRSVTEMAFPGAPETLKMACGENPKRVYGRRNQAPMTRMGNVAGYRAAFLRAAEYGQSFRRWQREHQNWQRSVHRYEQRMVAYRDGDEDQEEEPERPGPAPSPPARDLGSERLLGALEGRVLVQMHCYRADEMARMLEVSRELGFRVRAFHHAVEAYKVRDLLARSGTAIATWPDWWGFKAEAYDAIPENLALLTRSGVRGVLHSDSNMLVQRLNQGAARARMAGLRSQIPVSEDEALRWITLNAAWVLGVDDQVGSLRRGKMADVVVWSGHPFSVYSRADLVFIDGALRYDRAHPPELSDFEVGQEIPPALTPPVEGARP